MKLLILVALFALAAAEDRRFPIFDRTCEERSALIRPQVKEAFNVAAYSGTWFEIGRYQQEHEPEVDCLASHYSWGFITRSFRITRDGIDFSTGILFNREATALLAFPDAPVRMGLLNVTYYDNQGTQPFVVILRCLLKWFSVFDNTNYYVIATDYFQYAVGFGCEDLPDNQSREYAWVLSRTPDLPEEYNERVDAHIDRFFDRDFIRPTLQSEA